jgi:hypothetical protein
MVEGPSDTIVQTLGEFTLAGLAPAGAPGDGGVPCFEDGCRGGSN